jgi:hypothetical protein
VGGASAECTLNEKNWSGKDSFSLRSMAITRATGKAFRLSFAWIMQLAGFEPTPADEIFETGSEEDAIEVAKKKIEEHLGQKFDTLAQAEAAYEAQKAQEKTDKKTAKVSAFITWPENFNGHKFLLSGKTALFEHGVTLKTIEEICQGKWVEREGGWLLASEYAPYIRKLLVDEIHCPLIEKPLGVDLVPVLQKSIDMARA